MHTTQNTAYIISDAFLFSHDFFSFFLSPRVGKSLLYQLPAMLNEGVTLVISPLLSLMEDQIIHLRRIGIEAYMLCGTTGKEEVRSIHAHMLDRHSKMRLLYVTPEKIAKVAHTTARTQHCTQHGTTTRSHSSALPLFFFFFFLSLFRFSFFSPRHF